MQMMKLLFTVIFALQVCHLVKALVQNDSFDRRISKEVASSSATVPILPKAPRTNDSRNLKRTDGISKRVVASKVSLPENIPRLSDLLKESSLNDFSKTPGASMTRTRKETTLRKQNNTFAPSKQIFNSESSAPWKAGFKASIRTQGRIKKEFKSFSPGTLSSQRAKHI